jgi:hypothetical protein
MEVFAEKLGFGLVFAAKGPFLPDNRCKNCAD